jgi:hypothetical protein
MLRAKRQRAKEPFAAAAVNVAAAPVGSSTTGIQAGQGGERPLWALAPGMSLASVKWPFAQSSSSGTLVRMLSPIRLALPARRLLTPRCSGRIQHQVPSSSACMRAAELNR